MNLGKGALLVFLGVMALWLGVTGRFDRLAPAWRYLIGDATGGAASGAAGGNSTDPVGAGAGRPVSLPGMPAPATPANIDAMLCQVWGNCRPAGK